MASTSVERFKTLSWCTKGQTDDRQTDHATEKFKFDSAPKLITIEPRFEFGWASLSSYSFLTNPSGCPCPCVHV